MVVYRLVRLDWLIRNYWLVWSRLRVYRLNWLWLRVNRIWLGIRFDWLWFWRLGLVVKHQRIGPFAKPGLTEALGGIEDHVVVLHHISAQDPVTIEIWVPKDSQVALIVVASEL